MSDLKHIIVIGAGVVGLTTALKIQETGDYHVTIVAEVLPSDPKTIKYTSQWAGAQHVSSVSKTDKLKRGLEKETFDVMWDLAVQGKAEGCFMITPTTYYFSGADGEEDPKDFEYMKDFKYLPEDAIPEDSKIGISFTTLTIDVTIYLNYLLARFLARGGAIVRASVQHIDQVLEGAAELFKGSSRKPIIPDAVVVCTGIGSRFLGGVEDQDIFPIRGQTLFVRAPWVKDMWVKMHNDGWMSYIIPRKGGIVIVGGIFDADDWFPVPRPETSKKILERAFTVLPQLAPPEVREKRTPTAEDVDIVEEGCGLRPARKGGIRLEVESRKVRGGRELPVVFNYGHGGYGFQSSWGSARMALDLLKEALLNKLQLV